MSATRNHSVAQPGGGGGEAVAAPFICLSTKMQHIENTTFLALLRLIFVLE